MTTQKGTNNMNIRGYNIDWIIPHLRKPTLLWRICSTLTVAAVGAFSKIFIGWFNKTHIHHQHRIVNAIDSRPKDVALITVSNHHSCFDDPGLWASLNWRHVICAKKMRWSPAAHDICFTAGLHANFFMYGKCIPVVRGSGVYQPAIDFCIDRLRSGEWVHIFPEGKVNMTKEKLRLKWGVGRMIYEHPETMVLPIWHIGMDEALPNFPPYYLRTGKHITYNFGKPLDFSDLVAKLRARNVTDIEARKVITDAIDDELHRLKVETEGLHQLHFDSSIAKQAVSLTCSSSNCIDR